MSDQSILQIDTDEELARAMRQLKTLPQQLGAPNVLKNALNSTARKVRQQIIKDSKGRYALKEKKALQSESKILSASASTLEAAVLAKGSTVIENAAKEPHIVDLANFLNSMGADVKGAGTDTIKIRGVDHLAGGSYGIIPDQIEAGTYMAAVAAAGGQVLIKNVIPKHLDCISAKLVEMGVYIEDRGDAVLVRRSGPLQKTNVKTMPYPGFPTDMQPQIAAVLSTAQGTSIVNENVWNSRFKYIDELKRMGANIQADGHVAVIEGVEHLQGAPVQACDLRAGAAMVIAGLCAEGVTELSQVQFIERGYEDLVGKLRAVGADIRVVDAPDIAEQKEAHIG